MSLILNIDTATENAHVSIAKDGEIIGEISNQIQKDHASFVQVGISELQQQHKFILSDIDAVAVTEGPGSYTGLRVGLSSAKGICYALQKPIILVNTLQVLVASAIEVLQKNNAPFSDLFCAMIDARRMEVFTSIYAKNYAQVLPPCVLILDDKSYEFYLNEKTILFVGSGVTKWKNICTHPNASFSQTDILPSAFAKLSYNFFKQNKFADVAYCTPFYIKEFINL
jgi:tRNA threonylcarbamoyladenosine biosynthesis protein TsaB